MEVVMEERGSDLRDFINLRMSGFHALCVFLGVIGRRFSDAGLKDVMVEAGIPGEDAAQKVLRGKHYNNGMRAHLYIAEAMTRVKLDAFLDRLHCHDEYHVYDTVLKSDEVKKIEVLRNSDNLTDCMNISQDLFNLYEEFQDEFSDKKRFPMALFWNSYLLTFQTLRDYAKSIKTGDWDLHMFASEKMLHWFHTHKHFNYARHFSYYWSTQQVLPIKHPGIYQSFKNGYFCNRRSEGTFSKVSPDQLIVQTINKDQKRAR